jgi:2-polyprenyl-6-methoxyphenol hydroxylase-like FAD-dependent oxidoreductase
MEVLVADGGIAGLTMALTCRQIGVPVRVFESARELLPLGVGINLQPNAVRELHDRCDEEFDRRVDPAVHDAYADSRSADTPVIVFEPPDVATDQTT